MCSSNQAITILDDVEIAFHLRAKPLAFGCSYAMRTQCILLSSGEDDKPRTDCYRGQDARLFG